MTPLEFTVTFVVSVVTSLLTFAALVHFGWT